MLRHALAPMFEPGSLVIVADRPAGGGIPVAGAQGPLHGGRLRRGRGARAARQPERPGAGRASRPGPGLRVAGSAAGNAAPAGGAVAPLRHPAAARTARSVSARHAGAVPRLGRGKPLRAAGAALLRRAAPARRPEPQPAPGAGAPAGWPCWPSRAPSWRRSWTGPRTCTSAFPSPSRWATRPWSACPRCWTTWPATRAPTASCSIWRTSGRRASS